MSEITVTESWDSSSLTLVRGDFRHGDTSAARYYIVDNVDNETEAVNAAYEQSPDYLDDIEGKEAIPKKSATVTERLGEHTWKVQVDYGFESTSWNPSDKYDMDGDNLPEVCFQCSGATTHVTHAYHQSYAYTKSGYPVPANPNNIPIGWNGKFGGESDATGVDVPVAEIREQYTRILEYDTVRSSSWRRRVASCVGRINENKFKGWEPGEAMFMGCSYSTPQKGVKNVKVTFEFLIRTNEINAEICGIPIGNVDGHSYVWAVVGDAMNNNEITKDIKYIFKSRVCKRANFDKLGL